MNLKLLFRRLCIAACAFAIASAWADPPGRVGRITFIDGDVSFYSDRDEGWRKAEINYPVTSENSLWTEGDARTEVRFGPSAIRIGEDSVFDFVKLQDDVALGMLQRGSLNIRIRQFGSLDAADRLQIDTAEGRFTLEGNGRYRIDAAAAGGESRISVFAGSARFEGLNQGDARLTVDAGKRLTVRIIGGGTDLRYDNASESPFDRWAESRDREWDETHIRYARDNTRETLISPYMTGYEELDGAGDWIDDNEYGRLWTPRVLVAGWAPYRYGRWSYVRPWGWTWIDDAPWGFAPFHYGRWVQVRSRWCWWPGPYIGRPVYAPALVAWFGSSGGGFNISSGPAVGWFPLAPREHYIPRYTNNAAYLRRINYVTNNVTVINPPTRYRNQVPGATVVPNTVFVHGNPVGRHVAHVPPQAIAGNAPIASLDLPRPPRSAQMPDRRYEGRQDGQPGNTSPRPRFAESPPPAVSGRGVPVPTAPTPKYRRAEPIAGGPLPARPAVSEPVPAPAYAPALPGVNAPLATTPAAQPKIRPQPAYAPSHPAPVTNTAPGPNTNPAQVDTTPEREVRPGRAPGSQGSRGGGRPQPEVQYQAPQAAPPVVLPRASSPQPQAAPAPVAQPQPKATPAPTHAPKPHPDAQEENKSDGHGNKVKTNKE